MKVGQVRGPRLQSTPKRPAAESQLLEQACLHGYSTPQNPAPSRVLTSNARKLWHFHEIPPHFR